MKIKILLIVVGFLLSSGISPSALAASATVSVGSAGFTFTPATTNINAGDQVIWVWSGLNHSSTSDTNGLWDSGIFSPAHSFTNQFNAAGTYPYHCTVHALSGMRGSIIVTAPNSPPTVSITNPISGTVLAAPANVTIQATAADADGSVTNVQFLISSVSITNKAAAPGGAGSDSAAPAHTVVQFLGQLFKPSGSDQQPKANTPAPTPTQPAPTLVRAPGPTQPAAAPPVPAIKAPRPQSPATSPTLVTGPHATGEILVDKPSRALLDSARRNNFTIDPPVTLSSLGRSIVRLRAPNGIDTNTARVILRADLPPDLQDERLSPNRIYRLYRAANKGASREPERVFPVGGQACSADRCAARELIQ